MTWVSRVGQLFFCHLCDAEGVSLIRVTQGLALAMPSVSVAGEQAGSRMLTHVKGIISLGTSFKMGCTLIEVKLV